MRNAEGREASKIASRVRKSSQCDEIVTLVPLRQIGRLGDVYGLNLLQDLSMRSLQPSNFNLPAVLAALGSLFLVLSQSALGVEEVVTFYIREYRVDGAKRLKNL